jgi:methionyl-tRNA formyltransferase
MRIVFFGTSAFAANILKFLVSEKQNIIAIITRPDRPQGRSLQLKPPPVKETAIHSFSHIPVYQPEKASTDSFCEEMSKLHPDLFLVVAYGEIIKKNLLSIPKKACINIHASLLPKYRGAAPMQRCLMDGVSVSGVTIMDMVLQMDAGDIIAQEKVDVSLEMNCGQLEERLLEASYRILPKVLQDFDRFFQGKIAQNEKEATFANKIVPEETKIDWTKDSLAVHNLVRSLSPHPGAWCKVKVGEEERRLKILASLPKENFEGDPGQISIQNQTVSIRCGKGSLQLLTVQLEGKKAMPIDDFIKGLHRPISCLLS